MNFKHDECLECGIKLTLNEDNGSNEHPTPVEHYEQTGHQNINTPQLTGCPHCGYLWYYHGNATGKVTCSICKYKATPGIVPASLELANE